MSILVEIARRLCHHLLGFEVFLPSPALDEGSEHLEQRELMQLPDASTLEEAIHARRSSPPEAAVAAISAGLVTAPTRQVRV